MAKTRIDVDPGDLAAAREFLRTGTAQDTVNAALRVVAALGARRRDLGRRGGRVRPHSSPPVSWGHAAAA
jgi:Arc/MetJ family transcription regulator